MRHVVGTPGEPYGHVFLWNMQFAAGETKTLRVGYILPMSYTMGSTFKQELLDAARETRPLSAAGSPPKPKNAAGKPDHDSIHSENDRTVDHADMAQAEAVLRRLGTTVCVVVGFSYITETGRSWAGPIKHATFRFANTVFEHCLRRYPFYVGGEKEDLPPGAAIPGEGRSLVEEMDVAIFGYEIGLKLGTVYPQISPAGWKPAYIPEIPPGKPEPKYEPDGMVWKFENYKPGPPLEFAYYLLGFPEKIGDCDPWVKQMLGKTPTKAEVLELREILATFFGIAPKTVAVKRFVEQQIWFNPQSKGNRGHIERAAAGRLGTP